MPNKSNEVVFVPDLQILHHDDVFVAALMDYIIDVQPKEVIIIGDVVDCTAPARWNKGTVDEFAGNLQGEFDEFQRIFGDLRGSYAGSIKIHFGNHEQRISDYLRNRAPAFASLRCLDLQELLGINDLAIVPAGDFYQFADGWLSTHGHLGGKLSPIAGNTALGIAKEVGQSVVCGHTHRAGIISKSTGYSGVISARTGVEVGHGMREAAATYMSGGVMNWQKGFAYGTIVPGGFQPGIVLANADSTFYKDGKLYGKPTGTGNA